MTDRPTVSSGLWTVAVLWWGFGDYITTHASLILIGGAYESNAIVADVIAQTGPIGHLLWKIAILGSLYGYWKASPLLSVPYIRVIRHAIPIGLCGAGLWLTLRNLIVLSGGHP
jgi:hypothetical protein